MCSICQACDRIFALALQRLLQQELDMRQARLGGVLRGPSLHLLLRPWRLRRRRAAIALDGLLVLPVQPTGLIGLDAARQAQVALIELPLLIQAELGDEALPLGLGAGGHGVDDQGSSVQACEAKDVLRVETLRLIKTLRTSYDT